MMRKAVKQIGICALALILFCVLCRLTVFRTYTAHIPVYTDSETRLSDHKRAPRAEVDDPEVLELGQLDVHSNYISVPIHPKHQGEADIHLYDSQGEEIAYRFFRVGPMGTVFDFHTGGKAAFATTSYHVFRSGVWANLAGLPAEGIGGKTRWWFWPNAFMRECLGLLKNRWKQEILLMIVLMAFLGVLSMVLG